MADLTGVASFSLDTLSMLVGNPVVNVQLPNTLQGENKRECVIPFTKFWLKHNPDFVPSVTFLALRNRKC